jgi:hypothetical protein
MALYIGNTIIAMAKLVFDKLDNDPSTHRLQQLASKVTDKQLREKSIPPKYWPHIRSLSEVYKEFYFIYCLLTIV